MPAYSPSPDTPQRINYRDAEYLLPLHNHHNTDTPSAAAAAADDSSGGADDDEETHRQMQEIGLLSQRPILPLLQRLGVREGGNINAVLATAVEFVVFAKVPCLHPPVCPFVRLFVCRLTKVAPRPMGQYMAYRSG